MEGTVTIPIEEYNRLTGISKDFEGSVKAELKRMNDADRTFVLRDRDEYVRRNERLFKEKAEAQEEARKVAEMNVKLRAERDSMFSDLLKARAYGTILENRIETAEQEIKKRDENEKTLRETVNNLRETRRQLLLANDALIGRGFFARLFNRRP